MRDRRGFALAGTLWALVLLSAVALAGLASARVEIAAGRNRLVLARADWARHGCVETALSDIASGGRGEVDSMAFSNGAWCQVTADDPARRLHLALLDSAVAAALFGTDSLVAALLDWLDADTIQRRSGAESRWYRTRHRPAPADGPLQHPRELCLIRGFEAMCEGRIEQWFTVHGSARLNPVLADTRLVSAVTGLPSAAARRLQEAARTQRASSLSHAASTLSSADRASLDALWSRAEYHLEFEQRFATLHATAGVRGTPLQSAEWLEVAILPGRAAILARATW